MTEPSEATCVPTALPCDEYDKVQKKAFTKWVNTHLMKAGVKVDDLYDDFSEGSKLITLVELLTGDQLPRETGGMRIHRRQNVQAALECLERHQVKLVGITSDHIADSNQKLILGLVWTLIFHFQLSSDNDDMVYQWKTKSELLRWAQMAVEPYEIKVNDFASSWSDGTAFCAILHRHLPNMFDYTTQVDRAKPLANLQLAFNTAQAQLGVEKLLDPEDVSVANPDEKSILTYVSLIRDQFPVMPTPPDLIDGESRAEATQEKPGEEGSDILAQKVCDLSSHLVLLRRHVSQQAWGKGRALLEALGLNGAQIAKCYSMYHPNEEESVQSGLQEWIGRGTNITWNNLLKAMNIAGIAVQQCEELKKELYHGSTGGVHVTNSKERNRTISTASVGSNSSLGSLSIIPDIKAEYVEVKGMFVDICTAQGTPTLDEVKDHCLDLIECVFCNIPQTSHHEDDIAKARTMRELARVVCFRLSKWVSFDFFKKVVTHFQPTLRVVKERLTHYEDQLKHLLQLKLEYIAELQRREEVPRNMSELAVKYKLDADGLLVQDLLDHRDFLAERLGLPKHLLHVLSWGYGSVVIRYWVLRDVLPLAELALYREDARGGLTQHSVVEVCFAHHPSQEPNLVHVEQSPQTVHLQRRAIVTVLDAHRQDLDVTSLTSDLKDMGVLTADQCQKLLSLDDKEKRHDALLYTMLAHNKPDTYDKLVECTELRENSVAEDLQATYEDLLKSPSPFSVISTSPEAFSPMGDMGQPQAHIPTSGVPVVPELTLPRASITQYKEISLLPVKPSRSCKSLEECRKVLQHDPGGGLYVGVAANSEGLLAITDDANKCIHLLTKEGTLVRSIGVGVLGGSLFGVAFDLKGNIWVTDWEHSRVVKLSQDGRLLASSDKYSFSKPYGVGVCHEGLIYICDIDRNCVTVHDEEGKFLYKFGTKESGPGRFNRPHDITFGSDGLVYVSDAGNNRVCVQSKEGIFNRDFKTKHTPNYIAATSDSHLLITSYSSNTIMVYGLQGELVHEFGGYGSDPGQFHYPAGICIDDGGLVFVADYWKRRIQVFY